MTSPRANVDLFVSTSLNLSAGTFIEKKFCQRFFNKQNKLTQEFKNKVKLKHAVF